MKSFIRSALLVSVVCFLAASADAQPRWVIGGNMGLSLSDGNAGFHFGPMAEAIFERTFAVGSEFNVNTQSGTPVEWPVYFKYFFRVPGSKIQPYADAGFTLIIVSGGPYFGLRFGGGVNIPVAKGLSFAPDLQLGPVFASGSTVFGLWIRAGVRYEIPT